MAEIVVNFSPKGDDEVLEAIRKVTRHVGDLKKIAKTPIDLQVARNALRPEDFNRLKATIDNAKEATRDFGKEAERAAKAAERASLAAERATARKLAAEEKARVRMIAAAERATAKEEALAARSAARYQREAERKAVAAEKAAARAAAAAERAAAREARANPMISNGGLQFTGSMMGGGGRGGGGNVPMPLGGGPNYGPVDVKAFSTKAIDNLNKGLGLTQEKAKAASLQLGFVARIVAAMGVRAAVREVFQLADSFTTLQNKLKTVVDADAVGFVSRRLFEAAQNSRTSLESITTAFARTTRSVKSLGKSQEEVLQFTETLSKAIQVGGSTSVEASNAMIQLSQGMGSGALRGDELRSVLEQLPIVAELIADKMGVPISALRKLGSEGKLTTEVIFDAISEATESMNEKMSKMQLTVGQAFTMLRNKAIMESAAMSGVMNALANTIQFVTNNLEGFIMAIKMFASAAVMGFAIKGIIYLTEVSKTLALVWAAHPLLLAAGAIAVVAAGLLPLIANLQIASDSTVTFGDLWSSTWDEVKATFFGDEVSDGIKTVDGAIIGLSESTEKWILGLAKAADILAYLNPLTIGAKINSEGSVEGFAKRLIDRTNQDAEFRETERMIKEAKELMAEDMAQDKGEKTGTAAAVKKGKNPKGQTFDELMEDLNRDLEKTRLTTDLSDNSIPSQIAQGWIDAVDKLEDKVANGLTDAQSELINKTLEEKILIDEMLKAQEKIQKMMEERAKAERKALEEYSEKYKKFQADQIKLALDFQEARADRQVAKFDDFKNTARELDPNMKIREQVAELEKFKAMAKENNLADWAALATKRIEELKAAMRWENTHFETFANQMNSIFGPGGTLVKGFADAAANAIVMSESLSDLRRALVDVLNSVQKQALSSLIQLPMNLALGALTNSITGGGAGAAALSGGARSLSAAEASSIGFSSGGYTGNMGTNEPAGIVHGQEFVLNADATRRMGKQNLEMINKGGTPVSAAPAPANITINNNAGVQVEANQISPGQIEIMISKAIRDQTGRVVAGQINDPNSMVSRSLGKNIGSGERRRT